MDIYLYRSCNTAVNVYCCCCIYSCSSFVCYGGRDLQCIVINKEIYGNLIFIWILHA